jgi:hypothetical protein
MFTVGRNPCFRQLGVMQRISHQRLSVRTYAETAWPPGGQGTMPLRKVLERVRIAARGFTPLEITSGNNNVRPELQ